MPPREIIRCILLATYQLLWVKKLPIGPGAHLVYNRGLQIKKNSPRHMFACTRLRKKRVECVVAAADRFVAWHLPIRLNAMLQTEKFPTRIPDLDARLANVNADNFTHDWKTKYKQKNVAC